MTPNVLPSAEGSLLMALSEGGLQHLFAGARANVGLIAGRYMFEARVVEHTNQSEQGHSRNALPRNPLRIGFCTARAAPILGDSDSSICFDTEGSIVFNRKRTPLGPKLPPGVTLAVVINLDQASPSANTISIFREGVRMCDPQALPASLLGQPLYPAVTFKNMTVHVNFGPSAYVALPFHCRMVNEAAEADTVTPRSTQLGERQHQLLFPIFVPDEGTFDWLDWFLQKNPQYCELSDRMIIDWACKSGLWRPKNQSSSSSNDRPEMNFGISNLDDGSIKPVLAMSAAMHNRDLVVMEVKGNLLREERCAALRRFNFPHLRKVAQVMLGKPCPEYLEFVDNRKLRAKQEHLDAQFEVSKQELADSKQTEVQHQLEETKRKAGRDYDPDKRRRLDTVSKTEGGEESADHRQDGSQGESTERMRQASVLNNGSREVEVQEDGGGSGKMLAVGDEHRSPTAELTDAEQRDWFKKQSATADVAPFAMNQVVLKASLPDDREGFDEIVYGWRQADEALAHLKQWVQERKVNTRVEDLQPSDWFREKWQAWQKDLQAWHVRHMEYKDPKKRATIINAAKASAKESTAKVDGDDIGLPEEQNGGHKAEQEDMQQDTMEDTMDPLELLKEELLKEELDVFGVDDVCDIGRGEPLFAAFAFEDWALLSLRFEVHLLVHAFRKDCNDPERTGISPEHIAFYYNKYYKKGLNPKSYGVSTVEDLLALINDTVVLCGKVVDSQLVDELDMNDIFVALTEESRRFRQRRIDGDASARFGAATPGSPLGAPAPERPAVDFIKGAALRMSIASPAASGLVRSPMMAGQAPTPLPFQKAGVTAQPADVRNQAPFQKSAFPGPQQLPQLAQQLLQPMLTQQIPTSPQQMQLPQQMPPQSLQQPSQQTQQALLGQSAQQLLQQYPQVTPRHHLQQLAQPSPTAMLQHIQQQPAQQQQLQVPLQPVPPQQPVPQVGQQQLPQQLRVQQHLQIPQQLQMPQQQMLQQQQILQQQQRQQAQVAPQLQMMPQQPLLQHQMPQQQLPQQQQPQQPQQQQLQQQVPVQQWPQQRSAQEQQLQQQTQQQRQLLQQQQQPLHQQQHQLQVPQQQQHRSQIPQQHFMPQNFMQPSTHQQQHAQHQLPQQQTLQQQHQQQQLQQQHQQVLQQAMVQQQMPHHLQPLGAQQNQQW